MDIIDKKPKYVAPVARDISGEVSTALGQTCTPGITIAGPSCGGGSAPVAVNCAPGITVKK